MNNIAIFASGSGTNAENIIRFFRTDPDIHVKLVCSNKPGAKVLERAMEHGIAIFTFTRQELYETDLVLDKLRTEEIHFIVLAGFLWLVPENLLDAYPRAIVNIHPALLPRYGGKGMYGERVHAAVIANGEPTSGISIHYVNEKYDDGDIIFQTTCPLEGTDTPDSLAEKVHALEYEHYPRVIREVVLDR
ncbi:MAG: phosphoribosylglycinamide formyltransferase [Bacteroidales bacterium]|nr:phosphoribosylglycinamide formyltransferase [Bacteroidales bacterium]MDT8432030.1 phosphoribosylglycinamide formyltransferase [Bacteroidales bacterium]